MVILIWVLFFLYIYLKSMLFLIICVEPLLSLYTRTVLSLPFLAALWQSEMIENAWIWPKLSSIRPVVQSKGSSRCNSNSNTWCMGNSSAIAVLAFDLFSLFSDRESLNWSGYHSSLTTPLTNSSLGKKLCNCTCFRIVFILPKSDDTWYCIIWISGWVDGFWWTVWIYLDALLMYRVNHFLCQHIQLLHIGQIYFALCKELF